MRSDDCRMTPEEEERAVDAVAERLSKRFPQVSPQTITDEVKQAHTAFAASRIRDFVPLFVERNVRERLQTAD